MKRCMAETHIGQILRERLLRQELHHRIEDEEALVVVRLAGYELLEHT